MSLQVKNSDCILVLADHKIFTDLDLKKIFNEMRTKKVIDTKNSLSTDWKKAGFEVKVMGIGKQ